MTTEQFGTSPRIPRRGRGRSGETLNLLIAAYRFLEEAHPTTVRGVCYRLFVMGIIPDMSKGSTSKVSRILTDARERGELPWEWLVDETRSLEITASWHDGARFLESVQRQYRRDFWEQQAVNVECWSEKGTIRGVLAPVLDELGVGFRVFHGFTSATSMNEITTHNASKTLVAFYVGDYDPSGLCMSERDIPERLARYGGDTIIVQRIALRPEHLDGLPSFLAEDKAKDPRYRWFRQHYGERCWELDAMDPNTLREIVREKILGQIEPEAWARCERAQAAETASLTSYLSAWTPPEVAA